MVLILNGEVLQDNDPRAIAHRKKSSGGGGSSGGSGGGGGRGGGGGAGSRFGARIARVGEESTDNGNGQAHSNSGNNSSRGGWGGAGGSTGGGRNSSGGGGGGSGGGGGGRPPGPFEQLAVMLGVEGKTVTAPALMGVPETQVDLVYIIVIAVVSMLLKNWKIPIAAVVGFYIFNHQRQANPTPGGGNRAA